MPIKLLDLEDIEQGRFLERLKATIRLASRRVAGYVDRHGQASVGARYGLAFKLTFHVGDRGRVEIVSHRILHTEPGEPGESTVVRACMSTDGEHDLFTASTGTSADPEQSKLFAEDGRVL